MSTLKSLSIQVVRKATALGCSVATAESLTGGLIASSLAGIPGASKALMGGIVSYAPCVKRRLLSVPQEVIEGVGVVSAPCASHMAKSARERLSADLAVSATGVAGPGGGTAETPVGTVFLAVADGMGVQVSERHFSGLRQSVRRKAAKAALQMMADALATEIWKGRKG